MSDNSLFQCIISTKQHIKVKIEQGCIEIKVNIP